MKVVQRRMEQGLEENNQGTGMLPGRRDFVRHIDSGSDPWLPRATSGDAVPDSIELSIIESIIDDSWNRLYQDERLKVAPRPAKLN